MQQISFQALCFCSSCKGLQLCSLQRAPAHLRKELLCQTDPRRSALPQGHGVPPREERSSSLEGAVETAPELGKGKECTHSLGLPQSHISGFSARS